MATSSDPIRKVASDYFDALIKSRFIEMFGDPYLNPKYQPISFVECIDFNPKKSEIKELPDEMEVSFVPMEHIDSDGSFNNILLKKLSEVRKGYTYFRDGDVVFAKITPCFENGKVAIASNCVNRIGFGSTEFHVARPINGVSNSVWVMHILKSDSLRLLASSNMSGTAGQKRIQQPFFEKLKVGLPPIELQNEFADFVKLVDKSKLLFEEYVSMLDELVKSRFIEMFGSLKKPKYPLVKISNVVSKDVKRISKMYGKKDTISYIDISSLNRDSNLITSYSEFLIENAPSRAQQCIERGDILLSTVRPNLKNIAIYNEIYENPVCSTGFCVLRATSCSKEYLMSCLLDDECVRHLVNNATGSSYPAVTSKTVLDYEIPYPPIELQNEFADFVKQVDKSKSAVFESIKKLTA